MFERGGKVFVEEEAGGGGGGVTSYATRPATPAETAAWQATEAAIASGHTEAADRVEKAKAPPPEPLVEAKKEPFFMSPEKDEPKKEPFFASEPETPPQPQSWPGKKKWVPPEETKQSEAEPDKTG